MYHLNPMLKSNLDDLISSKISCHRCILAPLANDIGLVCLLPVHAESVFIAEDCDRLQGQLVCGTEDSNGDFSSIGN